MYGKYESVILTVVAAALLVLPLAGCQSGVERFDQLDSQLPADADHKGVLVPQELDVNGDLIITPEEVRVPSTYARSIEVFFADGGSGEDLKLTREEFAQALLGQRMPAWQILVILIGVVVVPLPIGFQLAKSLRMADHGWKMALILLSICAGVTITVFGWPPKLGIDLSSGVILIYEIDEEATRQQLGGGDDGGGGAVSGDAGINADDLAQQLRRRINPGGVSEIIVRPYGKRQVEIIIPNVGDAEIEFIKRKIEKTGQLEFLIVANQRDDADLINQALEAVSVRSSTLRDGKNRTIGRWVPVGKTRQTREEKPDYRGASRDDVLRARRGNQGNDFVEVNTSEVEPLMNGDTNFKQALDQLGYRDLQVLMRVNPIERRNVKGQHLRTSTSGSDTVGNPAVNFTMTGAGATLMGSLTSQNLADSNTGFHRRLGILMDNELISAPRLNDSISSSGIITGDFKREEVDELVGVLRAGRLPAVMRKDPISENKVSPLLGDDTIRSGAIAIGLSLLAVLVFMLVYYRFSGVVACIALLLNLVLILALMILVKATFTLPGLAGLVLTVGMSVDANVLVFERIREELNRNAALRMAIRNGFQRATTTIVDANLTTLITAIVLYVIGTDQIRGFAVTLILGILMSMYTAIFCSRVVFDVGERRRWITKLNMMHIVGETRFNFLERRKLAGIASALLILVGLGALVARGKGMLDIDFNGGTSVHLLFKEQMPIADFRRTAENNNLGDVSVIGVPIDYEEYNLTPPEAGSYYSFIVNSSITGEEFPEEGDPVGYAPSSESGVRSYTVVSVDITKETADLRSLSGETVVGVDFSDIIRDGVAVLKGRLVKLFPNQLMLHSLEVDEIVTVSEPAADVSTLPNNGSELSSGTSDPLDLNVGQPSADSQPPQTPDAEDAVGDDSAVEDDGPATDAGSTIGDESDAAEATLPVESDSSRNSVDSQFQFVSFQPGGGDASAPLDSEENLADTPTDDGAVAASTNDDAVTVIEEGESNFSPETPSETASEGAFVGSSRASLRFAHSLTAAGVRDLIRHAIVERYGEADMPTIRVTSSGWDGSSGARFKDWTIDMPLSKSASSELLLDIQAEQANSPVWLSSSKIGGQVAGDMKEKALVALLASLIGIVGYIWFRFQRVVFGLAAVVALLHDVLITLGAIALSMWIAKATMGVLLIDEFKISLPMVAALLTIIGYSLNDTIVVFDRIREVRGKNPDLTSDMINTSINQTLGRTLLTSITTLLVVFLLYLLGGQAVRGFAFALLVGVLVGTYSSIFVASPCLLWMTNAMKPQSGPAGKNKSVPAEA